jgi:Tfp pilus assembly protein PilX
VLADPFGEDFTHFDALVSKYVIEGCFCRAGTGCRSEWLTSDVSLEAFCSKTPENEPNFQWTDASAQHETSVTIVDHGMQWNLVNHQGTRSESVKPASPSESFGLCTPESAAPSQAASMWSHGWSCNKMSKDSTTR